MTLSSKKRDSGRCDKLISRNEKVPPSNISLEIKSHLSRNSQTGAALPRGFIMADRSLHGKSLKCKCSPGQWQLNTVTTWQLACMKCLTLHPTPGGEVAVSQIALIGSLIFSCSKATKDHAEPRAGGSVLWPTRPAGSLVKLDTLITAFLTGCGSVPAKELGMRGPLW